MPSPHHTEKTSVPGDDRILSWLHFGDLHITTEKEQNYHDFGALIWDANRHLTGTQGVSFAVLPGDNADDGTEKQFELVRRVLEGLHLPVHILPGDHDIKSGRLDDFYRCLGSASLPYAVDMGEYHCLFLNSVDTGTSKGFAFGPEQLQWMADELKRGQIAGQRAVLFMHTYPSELGASAAVVGELILQYRVLVVDMGHTHYNEIANDGRTIYTATRSTGQIEEGLVGFSLTTIDSGVVNWKFKELAVDWPLVMITLPADQPLITDPNQPNQVVRGTVEVRAKIWGTVEISEVTCQVENLAPQLMSRLGKSNLWCWEWDSAQVPDGVYRLAVRAKTYLGFSVEDFIDVVVSQSGEYKAPCRHSGDSANAIGAHEAKRILGTQLGPNKNGRKW